MNRTKPNSPKYAVALGYSTEDHQLRPLAHGTGHLAEKIIGIAQANGVPITAQSNLAETLGSLNLRTDLDSDAVDLLIDTICFLYQIEQEYLET